MCAFQVFGKILLHFENLGADVTRVRSDATNAMNKGHISFPITFIFHLLEANGTLESRHISVLKLHVPYHYTFLGERLPTNRAVTCLRTHLKY